ncbi:hypothetical protein MQW34_26425 [Bacillus sp. ZJS3]|nr:hypothetical protein MQW34_26425 [Bacillus sp. ZJS3]
MTNTEKLFFFYEKGVPNEFGTPFYIIVTSILNELFSLLGVIQFQWPALRI